MIGVLHGERAMTFLAHQVCCEHWTQGPSSLRCVKPELAWGSDRWACPALVANAWRATWRSENGKHSPLQVLFQRVAYWIDHRRHTGPELKIGCRLMSHQVNAVDVL